MKRTFAGLSLLCLAVSSARAAEVRFPVRARHSVVDESGYRAEQRLASTPFRVEVVADGSGIKAETWSAGRPFVSAENGERYSVRLYNPLPVRVAVNLSVDGLNSITGKPSGIADGQKWMIGPYQTLEVRGWQVNSGEARRFFFTDKPKSYAQWLGAAVGRDLATNCGVIGAAYFWSQRELDQYYESHPEYRYRPRVLQAAPGNAPRTDALAGIRRPEPATDKAQEAGTGMGERESHPVESVRFDYDAGMYSARQAVVIYYDFAAAPAPNPFPAVTYAPEMP